jgi:catechol 2,3-dioxygenase-like lactoylglutathione lyase family enzyme
MKRRTSVFYLSVTAMIVTFATSLAEDKANSKPQGMSLRLELFVTDMQKSIDFYTNVLGFERLKGEPTYVPVRSGSVVIGLGPVAGLPKQHHFNPEVQTSRRGLGAEIVLEVEDVQAFFEKVKASGYKMSSPLRKQSWGATDFRLVDPDGFYLRITSR